MTQKVTVESKTQIIVVEPTSGSVSVINAGPPGPAGPPGADGVGSGGFPIIENDGTYGYAIDIPSSGTLRETVIDNATNNYFATRSYYTNGIDSTILTDAVESATGEFEQILVASDSAHQSKLIWSSSDAPSQCNVNLGSGDPNGVVGSPKGSLFLDMTTPALWQSTAVFSWTEIGASGGGSAGFPVTLDDGTTTYTIVADDAGAAFGSGAGSGGYSGQMGLVTYANSDPTGTYTEVRIGPGYMDTLTDAFTVNCGWLGGNLRFINSQGNTFMSSGYHTEITAGGYGTNQHLLLQCFKGGNIIIDTEHGGSNSGNIISLQSHGGEVQFWGPSAGASVSGVNLRMTQYGSGADPAAPPTTPARQGRIYMRDNGVGKMQFCALFPTGAVQVIATEP